MQIDFSNQLAVVTGAAQGIGRAIAQGLMDAGALVHLLDIDEFGVAKTARDLDVVFPAPRKNEKRAGAAAYSRSAGGH